MYEADGLAKWAIDHAFQMLEQPYREFHASVKLMLALLRAATPFGDKDNTSGQILYLGRAREVWCDVLIDCHDAIAYLLAVESFGDLYLQGVA